MGQNIRVESAIIQTDGVGKHFLLCLMNDGSQYTCDSDGTNWKIHCPSKEELSKKFNEEITTKKKS